MLVRSEGSGRVPWALGLVVAALFAAHVYLALQRTGPLIFADEVGYLGAARYFAGGAPILLPDFTNYAPGSSILITPLAYLFPDPLVWYRAVLVFYGALLSLVVLPLYTIARKFCGEDAHLALAAATTAALFPSVFLESNLAWAEAPFVLVFSLVVVAFFALVSKPSLWLAVTLGLMTGFLYGIHGRALPLVPLMAVMAVVLMLGGRLRLWHGLSLLVSVGGSTFAMKALRQTVREVGGAGEVEVVGILGKVLLPGGLQELVAEAAGQAWYLVVVTFGLVLLGVVFACRVLHGGQRNRGWRLWEDPVAFTALFLLLGCGAMFAVSTLFMMFNSRSDHMFYGRYNEGFSLVLIVLGLVELRHALGERDRWWRNLLVLVGVAGVTTLLLVLLRGVEQLNGNLNPVTVLGIWPWRHNLKLGVDPGAFSWLAVGGFLVISALGRIRWGAGLGALGAVFVLSSWVTFEGYFYRGQGGVDADTSMVETVGRHSPERLAYDLSRRHTWTFFRLQFFLPDTQIVPFNSARGERPTTGMVVAHPDWRDALALNAFPLAKDTKGNQALWVLPSYRGKVRRQDYRGIVVGRQRTRNVEELGFLEQEWRDELPFRRTGGHAKLRIPFWSSAPPGALRMALGSVTAESTPFSLHVDGIELHRGVVGPEGWDEVLEIPAPPTGTHVRVEILSGARADRGSAPSGVEVHAVQLLHRSWAYSLDDDPLAEYRSVMAWEDPEPLRLRQRQHVSRKLRVTNPTEEAWANLAVLGSAPGAVRLAVKWYDSRSDEGEVFTGRVDLPNPLPPGATTILDVPLAAVDARGKPLSPGTYTVVVGLVQELVVYFSDRGDQDLKLEVVVERCLLRCR